ncbi:hypothetical protein C7974DRAFT_277558, partial [Boeremia exigua]|uniref:uncharacterized protein n=1 Tax=Boeremia exigua TaxID=749465 RepID=UPI001E8D6FDD
MCKIIKYRYACQHGFSVRLSKCGGTKHKQSRRRPTAACKPGAYINMFIPVNCGPCEFLAFERDRDRKLSMAEGFLEKITEKQFPGVLEVTILVDELKNRLSTETWVAQKRFPDTHKDRTIIRVELGHSTAQASPLRNEVFPDDIPEPPEVIHPDHPDYVYDYDYVASTDPLHPVDVNYTVYETDSTWIADYFSPEDLEQTGDEVGFDATDEANAAWTANTPEPPAPTS